MIMKREGLTITMIFLAESAKDQYIYNEKGEKYE